MFSCKSSKFGNDPDPNQRTHLCVMDSYIAVWKETLVKWAHETALKTVWSTCFHRQPLKICNGQGFWTPYERINLVMETLFRLIKVYHPINLKKDWPKSSVIFPMELSYELSLPSWGCPFCKIPDNNPNQRTHKDISISYKDRDCILVQKQVTKFWIIINFLGSDPNIVFEVLLLK